MLKFIIIHRHLFMLLVLLNCAIKEVFVSNWILVNNLIIFRASFLRFIQSKVFGRFQIFNFIWLMRLHITKQLIKHNRKIHSEHNSYSNYCMNFGFFLFFVTNQCLSFLCRLICWFDNWRSWSTTWLSWSTTCCITWWRTILCLSICTLCSVILGIICCLIWRWVTWFWTTIWLRIIWFCCVSWCCITWSCLWICWCRGRFWTVCCIISWSWRLICLFISWRIGWCRFIRLWRIRSWWWSRSCGLCICWCIWWWCLWTCWIGWWWRCISC